MSVFEEVFSENLDSLWSEWSSPLSFLRSVSCSRPCHTVTSAPVSSFSLHQPPLQHWLYLLCTLRCYIQLLKPEEWIDIISLNFWAVSYSSQGGWAYCWDRENNIAGGMFDHILPSKYPDFNWLNQNLLGLSLALRKRPLRMKSSQARKGLISKWLFVWRIQYQCVNMELKVVIHLI